MGATLSQSATDRYVIGPIRSARERAEQATQNLRRALDESDMLSERAHRDLLEALIVDGAEWAQRIDSALTVIREANQ